MNLTEINPTKESIKELAEKYPKDTKVTMLNILRFNETTETGESGIASYKRYGAKAQDFLNKTGAKVIWAGEVLATVIGDSADMPHQILLVEYPSVDSFLSMVLSPEYQAITADRTMALQYGGLYACQRMVK